jgi:cyclin-dependent kinase 8/11
VLYLHSQHILHRDLKPANVLVSTAGVVKVGDLGLARVVREPLQTLWAGDKVVVTIWYRAPELLLGARHYGRPTDLWAVACVMAELAALRPIFKGEEAKMDAKKGILFQRDQMIKIFDVLGSVKEDEWPSVRDMPEYPAMRALGTYENRLPDWCQKKLGNRELVAYDFMRQMLVYDPAKRLTAETAMKHRWFTDDPLPTAK